MSDASRGVENRREVLAPTGVLRAAINLGNPVLASGTEADPTGVTVELARAIADEYGLPVELTCFDAARASFAALTSGDTDIAFLAIEPARAEQVAFTSPYVLIDGVFVVPADSTSASVADLDRPGVRIGVKRGSAYDLYLTRTVRHAELVRGDEGVDVYLSGGLEAGAGIRQPAARWAASHEGHRVIDERFMQIRQAVAVSRQRPDLAVAGVDAVVRSRIADGSVARWLDEAGRSDAEVATLSADAD